MGPRRENWALRDLRARGLRERGEEDFFFFFFLPLFSSPSSFWLEAVVVLSGYGVEFAYARSTEIFELFQTIFDGEGRREGRRFFAIEVL